MITTSPELQQQIHRLSCLDGYTKVGAAEIEAALCAVCENEPHAYAVVQHFIENFREYPRPVEVRQIAGQVGPPMPARMSIHDPNCPRCNGIGFISETRTVDGTEVSFSRKCHGPSITIERQTAEYHPSGQRQTQPLTPEEREELNRVFRNGQVKTLPPAPPAPAPEYLVEIEQPPPKLIINSEAAALKKAAELEELRNRFGRF